MKYNYLYNTDLGEDDIFPMKESCTSGKHEFVAYITHEIECVGTAPNVRFRCQKCNKAYFGRFPYRYGNVISEKYEEHFINNTFRRKTTILNSLQATTNNLVMHVRGILNKIFVHRSHPQKPPMSTSSSPPPPPPPPLKHDPIEDTEAYKAIAKELNQKLERSFSVLPCDDMISVWDMEKQILLRDYGIKWKAPYEIEENKDLLKYYFP